MNYQQYQALYAEAKKQIAERVKRTLPRAGNGASVNAQRITVDNGAGQEQAAIEPTWNFFLFAQAVGQSTGEGNFDTGVVPAAFVSRKTGQLFQDYFWGNAQLFNFIPDDGQPPFSREFTLNLFSNSADNIAKPLGFKFPVRVVLEMVRDDGVVVADYTFYVRYGGASRGFTAPTINTVFVLRVKSIERIT